MVHIFGIRHHGPGSARSLVRALDQLQPDLLLIEGPPDADELLPLLDHPDLEPPVALLVYAAEMPRRAAFYPFARFSPELQAIRFALARTIPLRFCDLPQRHWMALADQDLTAASDSEPAHAEQPADAPAPEHPVHDPLGALAAAAGYSDGERWWELMVEHRRDDVGLFAAILEAMGALREHAPPLRDPVEPLREAWMRRTIRQAEREGFQRIAVVCGAWHAPVLVDHGDRRGDDALLKNLPKIKTAVSLAPWTYGHLAMRSGYGAGVLSPGWYDHLWAMSERNAAPRETTIRWLTHAARLLRAEDLDASSAHVIEAARLAEALAALRNLPLPGLAELDEAARAVFGFGADAPLQLIHERLVVGQRIGRVPDEAPSTPLQQDLRAAQRRLRLAATAEARDLDLDLRKPNDRERSLLLRRLNLIGVDWGVLGEGSGLGTFRELWRVLWQPGHEVALIEAAAWGTTVELAATAHARRLAAESTALPELVAVVNQALLADLPAAIDSLMQQLQARAAQSDDVGELMDALVRADPQTRSSLAAVLRYGSVRDTDTALVGQVVDGLLARICVGLPYACASLDDDAAEVMLRRISGVHEAVSTLDRPGGQVEWLAALHRLADLQRSHGLVIGRAVRILLDTAELTPDEAARRLRLALSVAVDPAAAAAWADGLLRGSGLLLIHDEALWSIVDRWLSELSADAFQAVLPLMRRAFAEYSVAERRQLGERAVRKNAAAVQLDQVDFAYERAAEAIRLTAQILGLRFDV
ncbi:MAG: hypothetical protein HC822_03590 [Oscillochloris sp.]|nr:hypothetical protein [Oscillochloris sp.]